MDDDLCESWVVAPGVDAQGWLEEKVLEKASEYLAEHDVYCLAISGQSNSTYWTSTSVPPDASLGWSPYSFWPSDYQIEPPNLRLSDHHPKPQYLGAAIYLTIIVESVQTAFRITVELRGETRESSAWLIEQHKLPVQIVEINQVLHSYCATASQELGRLAAVWEEKDEAAAREEEEWEEEDEGEDDED